MNLRAMVKAFDLEGYLHKYDPQAKIYEPNLAVRCPHCETDQKVWVLLQDKSDGTARRGAWLCYKCDESGADVRSLLQWLEQCTKLQAYQLIADGMDDRSDRTRIREVVLDALDGLEGGAGTWQEEPLVRQDLPREFELLDEYAPLRVQHYAIGRGISMKRAYRYAVGYCLSGYFRRRLVVPVVFEGDVAFFVARYMRAKPPHGIKKTIYPKGSQVRRVLFNYDRAKREDRIIIVEDVFSAMHVGRSAVATFGTSMSAHQLELLLDTQAQEVVVLWDHDAIDKAHKLAARLSEFWSVRVVELPDSRDPDETPRRELLRLISEAPAYEPGWALRSTVAARL